MLAACQAALPADVAVFAAAVADWRVANTSDGQDQEAAGRRAAVAGAGAQSRHPRHASPRAGPARPRLVVGFAAETDDLMANAQAKLRRKNADWIVANDVSPETGIMGGAENAVHLITADGVEDWPQTGEGRGGAAAGGAHCRRAGMTRLHHPLAHARGRTGVSPRAARRVASASGGVRRVLRRRGADDAGRPRRAACSNRQAHMFGGFAAGGDLVGTAGVAAANGSQIAPQGFGVRGLCRCRASWHRIGARPGRGDDRACSRGAALRRAPHRDAGQRRRPAGCTPIWVFAPTASSAAGCYVDGVFHDEALMALDLD